MGKDRIKRYVVIEPGGIIAELPYSRGSVTVKRIGFGTPAKFEITNTDARPQKRTVGLKYAHFTLDGKRYYVALLTNK